MFRRLGRRHRSGQRDFLPRFQRRATGSVSSTMLNFSAFWNSRPSRTSSRPIGAPLGARVLSADVVGRKRLMAELADFFRVRAAEHLDHVLDADAKSAFLADAINAREKFLCGQRAIPGRARRQAVVAAAAVYGSAGLRPGVVRLSLVRSYALQPTPEPATKPALQTSRQSTPAKIPGGRSRFRHNESSAPVARGRFRVPADSVFRQ